MWYKPSYHYCFSSYFSSIENIPEEIQDSSNLGIAIAYLNDHLIEEYYSSGNIKAKIEGAFEFRVDTNFQIGKGSYCDVLTIDSGYVFTPNGQFEEYFDNQNHVVKAKGKFKFGHQYGEWEFKKLLKSLIEISSVFFNDKGNVIKDK